MFDKIASVFILLEKYVCILALEMASPGNQHCANCIGTLSFAMCEMRGADDTDTRSKAFVDIRRRPRFGAAP